MGMTVSFALFVSLPVEPGHAAFVTAEHLRLSPRSLWDGSSAMPARESSLARRRMMRDWWFLADNAQIAVSLKMGSDRAP